MELTVVRAGPHPRRPRFWPMVNRVIQTGIRCPMLIVRMTGGTRACNLCTTCVIHAERGMMTERGAANQS
jgi:hypothetical protein